MTRRGAVVARWAHNPKVSGSNPLAATNHPFSDDVQRRGISLSLFCEELPKVLFGLRQKVACEAYVFGVSIIYDGDCVTVGADHFCPWVAQEHRRMRCNEELCTTR